MGQDRKEIHMILADSAGELEDRRSRFLSALHPVRTEEEALAFIAAVKKQYWDARHHCFAYIVEGGRTVRCSDDVEPQGTAGRPILDVLTGAGLQDVICVVTRYFGGTLLGTGGLVRAYSGAASDAVKNAEVFTRREGVRLCIRMNYTDLGKIQYLLGAKNIPIVDSVYAEDVRLRVMIRKDREESLRDELNEATGARVDYPEAEDVIFAESQNGQTPRIISEGTMEK